MIGITSYGAYIPWHRLDRQHFVKSSSRQSYFWSSRLIAKIYFRLGLKRPHPVPLPAKRGEGGRRPGVGSNLSALNNPKSLLKNPEFSFPNLISSGFFALLMLDSSL
jgi:hypothetical protein